MIKKTFTHFCFFPFLLLLLSGNANSQDDNWTHFRGNNLNSISETTGIPLTWNDSNTKWKTEIHDKGYSSPVVYGNQVWVTTARSDGKELYAVCVDFTTGKIVYDINVLSPENVIGKHSINTYASPTPCIEDGFVYVHFGSMGTACIRTSDGSILWKRTDLKCNHVQGPGSSPILYKNLLILHFEGTDTRYLVALDKTTGETVWKTDRPVKPYDPLPEIGKKAYVTPILVTVKGKDLIISNGSAVCCAYDPLSGKEIWSVVRGAESTVPMPVAENGKVYFYTGSMVDTAGIIFTEIVAVNPDGKGDITDTNILWKKRDDIAHTQMLTPLLKDGLIYTVNSKNVLMCIDAENGGEIWSQHLKSNYNASPVYENGIVWLFSVKGEILAIKAGRKFDILSQDQTDSGIWATPALVRHSMILRSEKYLYKISD